MKKTVLLLLITLLFAAMAISSFAADTTEFEFVSELLISPAPHTFRDLSAEHWAYNDIMTAVKKGWFIGTDKNTFTPEGTMTRGMFVTAMSRITDLGAGDGKFPFEDVAADAWYAPGVAFAFGNGVVTGDKAFRPDEPVTREEIADMLYRLAVMGYGFSWLDEPKLDFADGESVSSKYAAGVAFLAENEIVVGYSDKTFRPKNSATRAEVAAILNRAVNVFESSLYPEQRTGVNVRVVHLNQESDPLGIRVTIPSDWRLTCQNQSVSPSVGGSERQIASISRNGEYVGYIAAGDAEVYPPFRITKEESFEKDGITCKKLVLATDAFFSLQKNALPDGGKSDELLCLMVYSYKVGEETRRITMYVDYEEALAKTPEELLFLSTVQPGLTDPEIGTITLDKENEEKPILILGNSFVSTSKIGYYLNLMTADNEDVKREHIAVSVGYATVSETWGGYRKGMRDGEYAAVFMCGFYSSKDVTAFADYIDDCKKSDTPIIILPAYNETSEEMAMNTYKDIYCLNWKKEIRTLNKAGVPKELLCMDDTYSHSKPLAGYIGAGMIYRAVYGKLPDEDLFLRCFPAEENQLLLDYAKSGRVKLNENVYILSAK